MKYPMSTNGKNPKTDKSCTKKRKIQSKMDKEGREDEKIQPIRLSMKQQNFDFIFMQGLKWFFVLVYVSAFELINVRLCLLGICPS